MAANKGISRVAVLLLYLHVQTANAFVFIEQGTLDSTQDRNAVPVIWQDNTVSFSIDFLTLHPAADLNYDAAVQAVFTHYNDLQLIVNLSGVSQEATGCITNNRVNDVVFVADKLCDQPHSWGDAIGLTMLTYQYTKEDRTDARIIETDIYFKQNANWIIQNGPCVINGALNFTCTALHEFGHSLGLGHPDELGQIVQAIMNSRQSALVSSLLQTDDINGVAFLYADGSFVFPDTPAPITYDTKVRRTGIADMDFFVLLAALLLYARKKKRLAWRRSELA